MSAAFPFGVPKSLQDIDYHQACCLFTVDCRRSYSSIYDDHYLFLESSTLIFIARKLVCSDSPAKIYRSGPSGSSNHQYDVRLHAPSFTRQMSSDLNCLPRRARSN